MPAYDLDMVEAANGMRHHPPTSEDTVTAHELARSLVFGCLALLHEIVPASRDKSLMNTHLEDALMRANRAIAVNEGPRRGADLRMIAANLNAIMGDWARVGWQPDYPSDEEEQAHPPAARADATEERPEDAVRRLAGELEAIKARAATGAESAARAFQSILIGLPFPGVMVPTAINMPWEETPGQWRNTLVAVFSEMYGQGTLR